MKGSLNTVASLVKADVIHNCCPREIICNRLFLGFVRTNDGDLCEGALTEKKGLFDAARKTSPRYAGLKVWGDKASDFLPLKDVSVDMNTTSLIYTGLPKNEDSTKLLRRDFWLLDISG